jgi:hypothetical protein
MLHNDGVYPFQPKNCPNHLQLPINYSGTLGHIQVRAGQLAWFVMNHTTTQIATGIRVGGGS